MKQSVYKDADKTAAIDSIKKAFISQIKEQERKQNNEEADRTAAIKNIQKLKNAFTAGMMKKLDKEGLK